MAVNDIFSAECVACLSSICVCALASSAHLSASLANFNLVARGQESVESQDQWLMAREQLGNTLDDFLLNQCTGSAKKLHRKVFWLQRDMTGP
jgi:hypothetical protein